MQRRPHSFTLLQASQNSPTLARLAELTLDSKNRFKSIEFLIPVGLRAYITPGPIEGSTWCLILGTASAAAKLRQLIPAMAAHLRVKGWDVNVIRLKIQVNRPV
ncbi:MAG: hypothetical protein WAV85_16320 [Rhodoferax sp.]